MSVGFGLVPYGIGDWGSEGTVIPDTGSIGIQSTAPVVDSGVVPTGGAVIVGSAPSVIVIGSAKIPGSGALGLVGHAPSLLQDYRIVPAANDLILAGGLPDIDISSVITVPTGSASIVGAAPLAVVGTIVQPGAADLSLVGQSPEQDSAITPATANVLVQGHAPGVAQSEVITPSGATVIIGGIPSVVVRGSAKTPGTVALSLVGHAPEIAQSRVITPPSGALVLGGNAPIIKNPNWVTIDDSQTPNWQLIAA